MNREKVAMSQRDNALVRIVKYVLIFWGLCVLAGTGMAVGLANAGMKAQDAFNSGAIIAFLPAVVAGVGAFLFFILG